MDDRLGLMYIYKTDLDQKCKRPAHLYLCAEMAKVATQTNRAAAHCFEIQLRQEEEQDAERDPIRLVYACESSKEQAAWVSGLRARAHRSAEFGTRRLLLSLSPKGTDHSLAEVNDGFVVVHGAKLVNWEGQPVGVEIDELADATALSKSGLSAGDVIVAINDQPCLSWKHAGQLFDEAGTEINLIVWQASDQ